MNGLQPRAATGETKGDCYSSGMGKLSIGDAQEGSGGTRRASLWALVVVIPWMIAMWFALHDWYNEIQLGKRAVTTSGTITRIERENHGQFDYEYTVAGTTYTGGEIIAGASFGVGQRVQVSYISDDPQTSLLTRFGAAGTRPVPLFLVSSVAVWCYFGLREFLKGLATPYDR